MTDANMTQTHFRCHDTDACKFGQAPCPTPDCCGCPVTHEGYTPAGAVMQIDEPEAQQSLQTRNELISLPVGFAWGLCGAAIAVICMKVFA